MLRTAITVACLLFVAPAANPQSAPATQASNPFFEQWKTPFGVPPFDRIKPEHFTPAFDKAMAEQRREIEAIAASPQPPTVANTFEAMDSAGDLLERVTGVFFNLMSAETNDTLQAIARETAPKMSALQDDIMLNERLFARVKTVWEKRTALNLGGEQLRLVEETYKSFVRNGANLNAEQKQKLRAINKEMSGLGLRFGNSLLKETNSYRLVIEKKEDLAGLPEGTVAAAADAAKAAGLSGKWLFTLQAPSIWPFLTYAENRELRRQILTAYFSRCDHGDEYDNKKILTRVATLRSDRARLLGFPTYAHLALEERMAKDPAKVYEFLNRLWEPALAVAHREAEAIQSMIREQGGDFKLEAWDWRFYAEKVKRARYDLDEDQARQYFTLDNVMQGAFHVANRLYGLKFTERKDIPVYHPEVRAFEVTEGGRHVGVFLADYHPRPGKRGGAWSSSYRGQHMANGRDIRPVVVNVCNFTRPSAGTPALLRLEEVRTLFHEFGHGLHSLLSQIRYQSLSDVPRDFVELPSQIMENWSLEPEVLSVYAKHYKTGEAIPAELVAKIKKAAKFNQGFATVEYLAASLLDMDWHSLKGGENLDARAFEKASLDRIRLMPEVGVRYRSPYFQHIFASAGYAAGYYSYIWSEVLDSDAFEAFKEKGLFDPATARSFRKNILEKRGTADAMEMYKAFRGREPSVEPLLEKRGLK
jgi:peptidyl-dipeptidase Dcp